MATDPIFDIKRPLRERTRIALSAEGPFAKGRREFHERPSQIAYAEEAADAIEKSGTLIAEAGTGTGKTFAYLTPANASSFRRPESPFKTSSFARTCRFCAKRSGSPLTRRSSRAAPTTSATITSNARRERNTSPSGIPLTSFGKSSASRRFPRRATARNSPTFPTTIRSGPW